MSTFYASKDPQSTLDYGIDWSSWVATGDAIDSAVWAIDGPDAVLTLSNDAVANNVATVRAAGGTDGYSYDLVCTVTTTSGLVAERTITLAIADR